MATVSEIYINPDSQINNNDINVGRDQLGLCVRINIPNGTVALNNIWTQSGLPGGLKPNTYDFVNNNVGNCNIILPAIGTTSTTASFGHEMQIYNDATSLGTITIQNSAFVNIIVLQIGSGAIIRATNSTNIWSVLASSSATVADATPVLEGIMYGLTPTAANSNTVLGFQSLNNYLTAGVLNNTILGYQAGINLTTNSSNNVIIGSGTGSGFARTTGNSNLINIGNSCKFTPTSTITASSMSVIGNNVFTFNPTVPASTSFSDTFVLGNNIGPRSSNTINRILTQDCTLIGNTICAPGSGAEIYNLNDVVCIGDTICNAMTFANELIVIGTSSLGLADGLTETIIITTDGFANLGPFGDTGIVAIGSNIAPNMTTGSNNTFIGTSSGISLLTGSGNTLIGQLTDASTAASNNVVIGNICNTGTGSSNVILGTSAAITSGSNNVVLGSSAASGVGDRNTVLGANASSATFANTICLGSNATAAVANHFVFGNAASPINRLTWVAAAAVNYQVLGGAGTTLVVDTATGNIGVIPSSRRYKENIIPIDDNFDIMKLEPVYFNFISDSKKNRTIGLIAEDVDKAGFGCLVNYVPNVKSEIDDEKDIPVKINDDYDDVCPESINYQMLSVILLKEIQDLKRRIIALEQKK